MNTANKTASGRLINEVFSDSPVSRVRIKPGEVLLRYSKTCTDDHMDAIYDAIMGIERTIPINSHTCKIKILDTDDLNTIQCEFGNTERQAKLIKKRGVDYGCL